jgi:hypothetical protein
MRRCAGSTVPSIPSCLKQRKRHDHGIALLLCVFSLLLLTGIAMGLMYMADTETRVDDNFRSSVQSYYGARAGVEEARDRMRTSAPSPITLPTQMPSTTGGVVYLVNTAGGADVVQPWNSANAYFDDEICQENYPGLALTSPGRGNPCSSVPSGSGWYSTFASTAPMSNSTGAMSYKWVRITLKGNGSLPPYYVNGSAAPATLGTQVCWVPSNEILLAGGFANCPAMGQVDENVYMLTSLAVTPSGARRMLQMEVTRLRLPAFPSALTLDGSGPTYGAPTSNPFHVSGTDKRSCGGNPLPSLPGVGAWDNGSATAITSAIPNNRTGNYTGSGGTSPDVENLNSPPNSLAPQWQTVGGINSVDSLIDFAATQTYTGPVSGISLGTDTAPQVTVVNGDLTVGSGVSGAGILMVTGNFNINGLMTFHGIVLVIGQGVVNVSGGGGGEFDGAFFVARTVDSSGNPLPDSSPPGPPIVNWSGGGGNGIYYDSCWVTKMVNNFYYIPLNVRELPY